MAGSSKKVIYAALAGYSLIALTKFIAAFLHPVEVGNPTVNYIVLGVAMIVEGGAWYFAFREFTKLQGRWGHLEAIQRG